MSRAISTFADAFTIRPPTGPERMAWRMLLPGLSGLTPQLIVRVAAEDKPAGRIVGAAAVAIDPTRAVDGCFPLDLHVIEPCRQRGLGRRLLHAVEDETLSHGVTAAFSWPWFAGDEAASDPWLEVWRRLGFEPWQREYTYATTVERAIAGVAPVCERLRERNRIPADARILHLSEAPIEPVVELHVRELGGSPALVRSLIDGSGPDPFDPYNSGIALHGDQVVGLGLVRIDHRSRTCTVDSLCVRAGERGRWVLPLMRYTQLLWARDRGIETVRYFALDQHTDTRAAADRLGAQLLRTRLRLRRRFRPSSSSAGAMSGASGG